MQLNINAINHIYAYDSCMLFTDNYWISVKEKAINELQKVVNVFNSRKLTLNTKNKK